jgi:CheY-like chemotaxis protein
MTKIERPIRPARGQRIASRARPSRLSADIALPEQPRLAEGVAMAAGLAESRSEPTIEAQAWLNEDGAVGAPARANPLRVLIVEDDGMIAWLISDTLKAMGHEVCGIANCEDNAVEMAARERPDLLLIDAHLDVGSGLGAVRRILLNGPVPHIFISGDALSAEHLGPGALALQKPFQDVDLERAIRETFAIKPLG